jgi:uncharacterized cupin superfamily protein
MTSQIPHIQEAAVEETPAGRRPRGDGWYVVNATDAVWREAPGWGRFAELEPGDARFPQFGINIHVLRPGEVSTRYHGENGQEDFLVLRGECVAIVEGEERPLRPWDFLHCPAWTRHAFVGAGDGPCAILMVGARGIGAEECLYPADPVAARHGTSVEHDTWSVAEAYAGTPDHVDAPYMPGTLPGA